MPPEAMEGFSAKGFFILTKSSQKSFSIHASSWIAPSSMKRRLIRSFFDTNLARAANIAQIIGFIDLCELLGTLLRLIASRDEKSIREIYDQIDAAMNQKKVVDSSVRIENSTVVVDSYVVAMRKTLADKRRLEPSDKSNG